MARKVLPLVGYKSLRVLNAYSALLLGVKMLPAYQMFSYEEFLKTMEAMESEDQEKIFKNAAEFVEITQEEVKALICFCTDKNGVPYTDENFKNINPRELVEIIVAVCMEMVKIKIDLVTDAEKKNSQDFQLT